MPIGPVIVGRVSQNLKSFMLLNSVQSNQTRLFGTQNQIATGLRFLAPSQDPARATAAGRLDRRLDILRQVGNNVRDVNAALAEGESAMQDANDIIIEAYRVASESAGDTLSAEERNGLAVVIDSMLERAVAVGNREHLGTSLFSGHYGKTPPFEFTGAGVLFRGDDGRLETILDSDLSQDTFTISGMEFFNAVSEPVRGFLDLDPALTLETRLSDLRGAVDNGINLGRILVSDGASGSEIDLTGAATVGDVIDLLNDQLPATLEASLQNNAIRISSTSLLLPANITALDMAGGTTAVDLGIFNSTPLAFIQGTDLDPKLTMRTTLASLNAGAGADLSDGFTIRNGTAVANIDFSGASTLEDVLNSIGDANIGVLARISEDGRTIEIRNRISGSRLSIEERGGLAATSLGVRSMHTGTRLSELNDGLGVDSVEGDDFRITTANGTNIDIDVNDLDLQSATLQDLIDLVNTAGGGAITASLALVGNGIRIRDNTAGAGTLSISKLNLSPAIDSLGLNVQAFGGLINGDDVNPVIVDSPFTALLELRDGLRDDDGQSITASAERLQRSLLRMQQTQGKLAAKAKVMIDRQDRILNEETSTQVLLSDVKDVDLTEAIVRFQQTQTALQANLQTASRVLNLSLLDFLR